jgi:hypothetical protein
VNIRRRLDAIAVVLLVLGGCTVISDFSDVILQVAKEILVLQGAWATRSVSTHVIIAIACELQECVLQGNLHLPHGRHAWKLSNKNKLLGVNNLGLESKRKTN